MTKYALYKMGSIALLLLSSVFYGCEKFLDEKSTMSLMLPKTYDDLQALMDNNGSVNTGMGPGLLEVGTDDYYLLPTVANKLQTVDKDLYFWNEFPGYTTSITNTQWKRPYIPVFVGNTVLDYVDRINEKNPLKYNMVKGSAFFIKNYAYLLIAQTFAPPYNLSGTNEDPGIPLKMSSDVAEKTIRSTVKETYEHIVTDLKKAVTLLPADIDSRMRPSRPAAYAALSRTYLIMGRYQDAMENAELALKGYDVLIDYANCDSNATLPFKILNEETIFHAVSVGLKPLNPSRATIDKGLYSSYQINDYRKKLFFNKRADGTYSFKGSYTGFNIQSTFIGLTVPELYLTLAECYARLGKVRESGEVLTKLLVKRYKSGFVMPIFDNKEDLLDYVLLERRKEMLLRGVRWSDLRRLNQEPRHAKVLERQEVVGSDTIKHVLNIDDKRYTYLIPNEIIEFTGIPQNPR
ncbi:RagB/SusD family nutrient uptake outer membrane protein [Sphingobacterium sp. xlx-130]|uniref:RagB/SusD family nutrient uptake outer membrane protein n=1 Tax=Sphingobacterium sp. xlx-130 TaxID=2654323 RepID=UPI0013DC18BF|nr:RagB/SusD family nutrient uptake outer membrane protein [Sphingobacterium sp. xlx-130]